LDLKAYYDARVSGLDPRDHLAQVGHTVNGSPIPDAHFRALLDQIDTTLALGPTDRLLDLCCGNGLFTSRLAATVQATCAADLSGAMIRVARADHAAENLSYLVMDAAAAATLATRPEAPFTKVLIYAAWQHFDPDTAREVLRGLLRCTTPEAAILLGFVPDLARKAQFFDTAERRAAHAAHLAAGTDILGTWWDRATLTALCAELGLFVRFVELPPEIHAATYRFNALLTRA